MKGKTSFQVGDHVMISRVGSRFKSLLQTEETGIVLATDVNYQSSQNGTSKQDGILVKLQITNTREVFPPENVLPRLPLSPPATTRNQRRVRITPSPAMPEDPSSSTSTTTSMESSEACSDVVVSDIVEQPRKKRNREDIKDESSKEELVTKKTKSSKVVLEGNTSFRVQTAPSSSGKCLSCKEFIRKDVLRLQLASGKRGWYHVGCAKESFPGTSWNGRDWEGFSELSEAEQRLLDAHLKDASTSTGVIKSPQVDLIRWDDEGESEDDPPLASMVKKKQSSKAMEAASDTVGQRLPVTKSIKNKVEEKDDIDSEDDMLHASDTDSDDLKDMPFRVEYATTGRATCKGCDERIAKGDLRVAEQPLFQGKPGYSVYRHLRCTVFGEQILRLQDVGGWRRLRKVDRQVVTDRVDESKILIEKENQELQPDELVQVGFEGEIRGVPKGLAANLLPFQVEGASWMVHQEVHIPEIRGGILADEMGMGKTLQTITTILDNRPKLQWSLPGSKHPPAAADLEERKREEALWKESLENWKIEMEKCNVPKRLISPKPGNKKEAPLGARAGTLVICPVIALYQWREEIKKFTDENALSVCCYHGPNRQKEFPREILCKYDVVLTTYQVIEADFRKMVSPNKVKCPNCKGTFRIDKLKVHLKYFCGERAQRTEAQARQRRTADRPNDRDTDTNRQQGKKSGSNKKAFKTDQKSKVKDSIKRPHTKKAVAKKTVRAKHAKGFESDSDLSVGEDVDVISPRSRRLAAVSASKKMTASAKKWGVDADTDDSDAFSSNSNSSGDSSDENSVGFVPASRGKKFRKIAKVDSSDDDVSSDDDSEAHEAVSRAMQKQKLALVRAKGHKTIGMEAKKSFADDKKRAKKKPNKKTLPSESSSDEDISSDEDRDPLDGIDLHQLMQDAMKGSRESSLHMMCWWRVVLDEAHVIKSRSSQTAAAAFALTSIHRWCLSGTPLQNRVGELYSLIRFLRIDPMAHYFCRKSGCNCKSVHYRMLNGKCLDCGHGTIQHYSHFNRHVLNPIQRAGYQGDGRRAMMKLKDEVLDKALIRRTKQSRAEDMNLPPRVVTIRTVRLHPIEEDFYNALYTQTKSSFDDYVTEGTLLNNYAHIFDLLTKMRQAVDHPYLIVFSKKNAGTFTATSSPVANGSVDCELCHEPPTDRVLSSCCGSGFCRSCVIDYMTPALESLQEGTRCPCCRAPLSVDLNQDSSDVVDDSTLTVAQGTGSATAGMPSLKEMEHVSSGSILRRINLAEFATSTKVEALVQELVQMRQHRPGSKALVFSQFVNMLDLIRWRLHSDPCLQDLGLGVRIIHGGMNITSRDEALKDFREDSSVRVLLMSLKAGGVALNLTVANEAYLLDPWWNPAAEMQAIDRTHRLGQYRPIRAVRFIAEGTVEERVLQLQEKKRLVFDGTVGRDAASLKMLTVEDMKAMFT